MTNFLKSVVMTMILAAGLYGQDCNTFYPLKKGAQFEMTEYDGAKTVTGKSITRVLDVKSTGAVTEASLESEHYNTKGTASKPVKYTIKCDGKTLYIDMQSLMQNSDKNSKGMEGVEMKAEGAFIELPTQGLQVGQTLKDAVMTMRMSQDGNEMGSMTMTVHRKILSKESVTVPAGTFDCYKISMEMESTMNMMGMKQPMGKTQTTEWFAVGTGSVKSETSRDGKVIRISELTKLTR